jgi:hypothetical protein
VDVTDSATEIYKEIQIENQAESERFIQNQLLVGEKSLFYYPAKTRAPFLIRICPLIPDLLFRDRKYLLVGTDRRLLILELENPIIRKPNIALRRIEASVPYTQIREVVPTTGRLTSSINIILQNGNSLEYWDMLRSYAESFEVNLKVAKRLSGNHNFSENDLPAQVISKTSPSGKILKAISTIIGLFFVFSGFTLFSEKDKGVGPVIGAFIILLTIAFPFLWFGFIKSLFKKSVS